MVAQVQATARRGGLLTRGALALALLLGLRLSFLCHVN